MYEAVEETAAREAAARSSLAAALRELEAAAAVVERDARAVADEMRRELVERLLPVLDDLDRTIAAAETAGDSPTIVERELVQDSDLILVMSPHHLERVEALGGKGKSHLLTSYASRGAIDRPVGDPFGGDLEIYRETYDELVAEIRSAFDRLEAERAHNLP